MHFSHLFEVLETRRLLAGHVTVVADENFVVTITGDKKSNAIDVSLSGSDGYLIRGQKGTTINGESELLLRSPVAVFMNVSMGKGNDVVNFSGTFNTQTAAIDTGDGHDLVRISGVSHFGDLSIQTGKGKDNVALDNLKVTQNLVVDLGKDKDTLALVNVQVEGNASVSGGRDKNTLNGPDQLQVSGSSDVTGFTVAKRKKGENGGRDDD